MHIGQQMAEYQQKIIHTKVGQLFEINLACVPTSGFVWELTLSSVNKEFLKLLDMHFEPDSSKVGGENKQLFAIKPLKSGTVEIDFKYKRPWEEDKIRDQITYLIQIE